MNHFTYNGISTEDLGLIVSGVNIYGSPSRVVEKINIPYRNGDLLIDTGAYNNYQLSYTVSIQDDTKATARAISQWLLADKGYHDLTDTYTPDIIRKACYYNEVSFDLSAFYLYGKATITFDCKPQKYLTDNTLIEILAGESDQITAETFSEPIIQVYGTGTFTINDRSYVVNQAPLTINSQTMQVYNGDINMNYAVEFDEFPAFDLGENDISTSCRIGITPNWWVL